MFLPALVVGLGLGYVWWKHEPASYTIKPGRLYMTKVRTPGVTVPITASSAAVTTEMGGSIANATVMLADLTAMNLLPVQGASQDSKNPSIFTILTRSLPAGLPVTFDAQISPRTKILALKDMGAA